MRRTLPFLLSSVGMLALVALVWRVFPDWLLAGAADNGTDPARRDAASEIAATILSSSLGALAVALVFGLAWALTLGRSKALDDRGARSKLYHWGATLAVVEAAAGYGFRWQYQGMEGVADGWAAIGVYLFFAVLALVAAALTFHWVTLAASAAHMRPSIPWGVSRGPRTALAARPGINQAVRTAAEQAIESNVAEA